MLDEGGDPLVYVTFGTLFQDPAALAAVVTGARLAGARVIVTVGPHGDPDSLGPQPSNVQVARYVPQEQLLSRCSAVASHGGSGTFLAAASAGVPQLCVPLAADQFLNAAACERAGIGLALTAASVDVEQARVAVAQLSAEERFAAAARRTSAELAAMPAPGEVASQIAAEFG